MPTTAVLTVATCNYFHYVEALRRSLRESNPGLTLYVCLADRPARPFLPPEDETLRLFFADELPLPDWRRFSFQYLPASLACALKGFALEAVLFRRGCDKVIYLDSDIQVYSPLERTLRELDDHDILLTPHLLQPLPTPVTARPPREGQITELDIKQAGMYNAGFLGMRRSAAARAMLGWWQQKMDRLCVIHRASHLFLDQSWLDFVPSLFAGVRLLKHPGYNVGYWNVAERAFRRGADGTCTVDGEPLVVFHYSGFDAKHPGRLSTYYSHFKLKSQPCLAELAGRYAERLRECDRPGYSGERYGHATLTDGTPIEPAWRNAVRLGMPELADVRDPFDAGATPGLADRYRAVQQKYGPLFGDPADRLAQLESLFLALHRSPLLGRLLRRYKLFRNAGFIG